MTTSSITRILQQLQGVTPRRAIKPRHRKSSVAQIEAFELENRILYSASPLPVDVIDDVHDPGDIGGVHFDINESQNNDTSWPEDPLNDDSDIFRLGNDSSADRETQVVFIDQGINDHERLFQDAQAPNSYVYLLSSDSDGIQQITDVLSTHSNISSVHIVSHGAEANIQLGNANLTDSSLEQYLSPIASWGKSLSTDADILFYGCDFAGSKSGEALIDKLASLTGAEIAASDDITGHDTLAGDWDLEYRSGEIEADIIFSTLLQQDFVDTLEVTAINGSQIDIPAGFVGANVSHATSGTDRLLLVGVSFADYGSLEVDSMTYDGVNLFKVGHQDHSSGDEARVEIWAIVAPASGSNQLLIDFNGLSSSPTIVGAISFSGVDQATPLGGFDSAEGDSAVSSTTTSSYYDELVYSILAFHSSTDVDLVHGVGQTEILEDHFGENNTAMSFEPGSPSTDSFWTASSSGEWAIASVSVKAAEPIRYGGVLTVTTTDDFVDGDVTSADALLFDKGADGEISLREAVLALNATPNGATPDEIRFDIAGSGVQTIQLTGPGIELTDSIIINGTTQAGYTYLTPMIEIDGSLMTGANQDIFRVTADNSTIRGLVLNNAETAIFLDSRFNTIAGNFIGTNATGTVARGNEKGIVTVEDSNTIGGISAADRNIISGNLTTGISLEGNWDSEIHIFGNHIGVGADGVTAIGNGEHGILLTGNANNSLIGGIAAGEANIIAFNGMDGVSLVGANNGNLIRGNLIYGNGDLGIDINNDGPTNNDSNDFDNGPNRSQNFPVLTSANYDGTDLTITGTLASASSSKYTIDLYASNASGSTFRYLSSIDVATDSNGNVTFNDTLNLPTLTHDEFITATATFQHAIGHSNNEGSTSEFSQIVHVNVAPVITSNGGNATATIFVDENTTTVTTVTASDQDFPAQSLNYLVTGGDDQGLFDLAANGVLTFLNAPDFEVAGDNDADGVYEVEVTVHDSNGGTDVQLIEVVVDDANEFPVGANDTYLTSEGGTLTVNVLAGVLSNDSDDDGDVLTSVVLTDVSNGTLTLNADGSFEYIHDGSESTIDSFTYSVADGLGGASTATVDLNINPENDAPYTYNPVGAINTHEDGPSVTIDLNSVFADDDDTTLSYSVVHNSNDSLVATNFVGSELTFSMEPNQFGTAVLTLQARDAAGATTTEPLLIVVAAVNDAPLVTDKSYAIGTTFSSRVTGNLLDGALDVDDSSLSVILIDGPESGTFVLNPNGDFEFTPDIGFSGTIVITFEATDGLDRSSPGTAIIVVEDSLVGPPNPTNNDSESDTNSTSESSDNAETIEELAPPPQPSKADTRPNSPVEKFFTPPPTANVSSSTEGTQTESNDQPAEFSTATKEFFGITSVTEPVEAVQPATAANEFTRRNYDLFSSSLDVFAEDLDQASESVNDAFMNAVVSLSGVSIGVVTLALRTGAVMASMMASVPAWRALDPLVVLGYSEGEELDDESILDIVEKENPSQKTPEWKTETSAF